MKFHFQLWLSLGIITGVSCHRNRHQVQPKEQEAAAHSWEGAEVDFDESFDSFLNYPREALEGLPNELSNDNPVNLDIVMSLSDDNEKKPLSSLLKGIVTRNHRVTATHHFYIQDGWVSTSTGAIRCHQEEEAALMTKSMMDEPKICQESCTNKGRYCLNGNGKHSGKELVMESARRMCFDSVFGPESTVLWEYMEAFDQEFHCDDSENMTECSNTVMDKLMKGNKHRHIVECVEYAGGLDSDAVNDKLEKAVEYQKKVPGGEKASSWPMLMINGQRYQGDYHVNLLLDAVCGAFPVDDEKPYSCEYCEPCADTRKCLWTLECDGEPLDAVEVFGPLPWYETFGVHYVLIGIGVCIVVAVGLLYAVRQIKIYYLIKELDAINRKMMDESLEARHVEGSRRRSSMDDNSSSSTRSFTSTPFFGETDAPLHSLM